MAAVAQRRALLSYGWAAEDVLATIPLWWERRAFEAGLPAKWHDSRRALPEPPFPLRGVPVDALVDAGPTELGEAYVGALEPTTRLREGRHYTPSLLADVLWREAREAGYVSGRIVDPASGAGSLLLPPLRQLVRSGSADEQRLHEIAAAIGGTDADPAAVWLGNAVLGAELLHIWSRIPERRRKPLPSLLGVGDGLERVGDLPQLVLMNPPYGRVRLAAAERTRWGETLYGHANRYALFLHAAIERVAEGGAVAAVLPTSFLGGAYFQRLRAFVAQYAPLSRVTFVDVRSGVFVGNVLQETCLAVFRKGARPTAAACSRLSVNGSVALRRLPRAPRPRDASRPWLMPRQTVDSALVRRASRMRDRLGDYGWKVSTGPLVWNRHRSQISASRRNGSVRIVWAADLDDGRVVPDPARDAQRWIVLRPDDEFMMLREPVLLLQRTTAPEQARRLVPAAFDNRALRDWGGAVVVENHVNVLYQVDSGGSLDPGLLLALLRTPTLDRVYRCLTGSVAVSAYELESMPLPPPEVLMRWSRLRGRPFDVEVANYYGDEPS